MEVGRYLVPSSGAGRVSARPGSSDVHGAVERPELPNRDDRRTKTPARPQRNRPCWLAWKAAEGSKHSEKGRRTVAVMVVAMVTVTVPMLCSLLVDWLGVGRCRR